MAVVLLVSAVLALLVLSWVAFSGDVDVTPGLSVLGFLFTAAAGMIVFWLTVGSWRRTVWGCPFAHAADAPWAARCRRHALLGEADDTATHNEGSTADGSAVR
jgi:hypothetical protein